MTLDARGVDLAAWNSALPATALAIAVRAAPTSGAIAGTIEATNAAIGTLDAGRIPLSAFSSRFSWRDDVLALESIAAAFEGGGTVAGQAQIPVGTAGSAGSWTLELRDIDLRRIYAPLVATRLSGKLAADLEREQQKFRGDVADRTMRGGIALDFSAVLANDAIVVDGFRARSGRSELAGRGRVGLPANVPSKSRRPGHDSIRRRTAHFRAARSTAGSRPRARLRRSGARTRT